MDRLPLTFDIPIACKYTFRSRAYAAKTGAPRYFSMIFNVAQLLQEPTGSERWYDINEDVSVLDEELRFLGPLVGELLLLRTPSGVLVKGELSTAVQLQCNRCLTPLVTPVRFDVEEIFHTTTDVTTGRPLRVDEYEGDIDDLDDAALLIDDKHVLDIREVVRQNIWLALPMYPACNWQGTGECAPENRLPEIESVRLLREGEVDEIIEDVDPRWAALRQLQQSGENEEQN